MIKISFFAGVEYDNKVYFSAYTHNGLYEMDLETRDCRLISFFAKEDIAPMLHRQAFLYKEYAWFIPQEGKFISKLNLKNFEISYYNFAVEIECPSDVRQYHAFACGIKEKNMLYLIPQSVDAVVAIDMESDEIKEFHSVIDPKTEMAVDAAIHGDNLYIFFAESGYYRKLDLRSGDCQDYDFDKGTRNVYCVERQFWILTAESKSVLKYDIENNVVLKELNLSGDNLYCDKIQCKNEILFLPFFASGYLHLDYKEESIWEEKEEKIKMPNWRCKTTPIDSASRLLWSLGDIAYIAEMDENFDIEYTKIEKDPGDFFEQFTCLLNSKREWMDLYKCMSVLNLEFQIGLDGFIKFVTNMKEDLSSKSNISGKEIWEKLED